MELLYLFLGWLLGLASPLIVERIKRTYTKQELLNGIKTELNETQFRILCLSSLLGMRYGKYDRTYLEWCLPYFKYYKGNEQKENCVKSREELLKLNDEKIEQTTLSLKRKQEQGIGLSLKKYHLPFLDSKIGEISKFNIELQNIIYEIISRLQLFNDEIDKAIEYHQMTFDSTISNENHRIIRFEITNKYKILQEMAIGIVKKMDNCIKYKEKI